MDELNGRPNSVETEESNEEVPIALRIVHQGLAAAPLIFGNHIVVTQNEHEFFLYVAQIDPPITLAPEDIERVMEQGTLDARVVAKLVFPATRMPAIIEALKGSLEKHLAARNASSLEEVE